jgi:hypothetical protein
MTKCTIPFFDAKFFAAKCFATICFAALVAVLGCSARKVKVIENNFGPTQPVDRFVDGYQPGEVSFEKDVKPILDRRCGVCHGCYDAPCQLKLTEFEGVERGASKNPVYDSARLTAVAPTRLTIDAHSVQGWRDLDFHPVLNERNQTPTANLDNALISLMLRLKKEHPQPRTERLPDTFDISLDKKPVCTTVEDFDDYKKKYPLWGMPYAVPGLTDEEHKTIIDWLEGGAHALLPPPLSAEADATIRAWEAFLNGPSLKERLVSRYIFEHLFIGHLHFDNLPDREFYRLVRSKTPTGQPVNEINTVRPYDDPGVKQFYYRFRRIDGTITAKNHTVYHLNDQVMARYKELFLQDDYEIKALPSYDKETSANPFKTFAELPAKSRYKFMLDNAQFFVMGFIKGPVCRGQIALNVINDHFFVAFFDPEKDVISNDTAFLASVADNLSLPSARKNNLNIFSLWTDYENRQDKYLEAKENYLKKLHPDDKGNDVTQIWNGEQQNPNALLTVFRHFDSAGVVKGFVGDSPETGWVIDFPLFERIHYLLVAGFDVFGNVGHQSETRLYMDFLRLEGENSFLSFLPKDKRPEIWAKWYEGAKAEHRKYLDNPHMGLDRESRVVFETDDPVQEFFKKIIAHAGPAAGPFDYMNRCPDKNCVDITRPPAEQKADLILQQFTNLKGRDIQVVQDLVFVHVITGDEDKDLAYTVIRNKALSNNSFMFGEGRRRIVENDTLTIVKGHEGSYPNSFVRVPIDQLETFLKDFLKIKDEVSMYNFAHRYAVQRTNPDFWRESDWHLQKYLKDEPVEAGLFDLYRFNRIGMKSDAKFKW